MPPPSSIQSLPVLQEPAPRRRDYGPWRAATLIGVYVLMAAHIVHWKIAGRTLAPLELNELMYTLELGIVTAGFIFMSLAVVSVLIFGRFFCSWGCHILALQDLCGWLLAKVNIRPKPVRSRALMLVPVGALFYMFVWPQVLRLMRGEPLPVFHLQTDQQGWASFVTDDFWRNLPSPGVAGATFLVCGFVMVYMLGSRTFCRYACPYGALFALADRITPGKIVLRGECTQCGECTAICTSHVRVHEEIATFGKVVDPACLKDLDCVTVCPEQAIQFGFTTPSLFSSWKRKGRRRPPSDFSWPEEALLAVVFLATLLIYRGLYNIVPFLMTLALGGMFGYATVLALRLVTRRDVRFSRFQLKRAGRIQSAGMGFWACMVLFAVLTIHSGFVRRHEVFIDRSFDTTMASLGAVAPNKHSALLIPLDGRLASLAQWSLINRDIDVSRRATVAVLLRGPKQAAAAIDRLRNIDPAAAATLLAKHAAMQGNNAEALEHFLAAVNLAPNNPGTHLQLAEFLLWTGRPNEAVEHLRRACELEPLDMHLQDKLRDAERAAEDAAP